MKVQILDRATSDLVEGFHFYEAQQSDQSEGVMRVEELSVEELKILIGRTVEEKLEEILGDPDSGLELSDSVRERLQRSLEETEAGAGGVSVDEVIRKTGLRW